eukprot:SAG22_NODE_27_length_29018_cov_465.809646_39_plen_188_part_00
MNSEKKFCFVTFRTEDESAKGLQLDNIQLMGRQLRIGRPSDYVPPTGGSAAAAAALSGLPGVGTSTNNIPLGTPPPGGIGGAAAAPAGPPPTTVVRLANAVTQAEIEDSNEYADIMEDMTEECQKFGTLASIKMPKEGAGKGLVFIKFADVESATKAKTNLHNRQFESRRVDASFYQPEAYDRDSFK